MIFRSRAPLRLGLAGGGTDVAPYSDTFGGNVLNASISLYAKTTIRPLPEREVVFISADRKEEYRGPLRPELPIDGRLDLLKAVHNRVSRDFGEIGQGYEMTSYVDAPAGSGLGTSSTLTVAALTAFAGWLSLPLGEYDLARLAYEIERRDLGWAGGKQDQYAATFGGFNFMEFSAGDKVIVNPLRIRSDVLRELETSFVLYYLGTSRLSAKIIEAQSKGVASREEKSMEAMHKLKEQAILMKEAILKGHLEDIGPILDFGWKYKKQTSSAVSNPMIDNIYAEALHAGATGGKISGAGGGGFMMFFCPGNTRYSVIDKLSSIGGEFRRFNFEENGAAFWSMP